MSIPSGFHKGKNAAANALFIVAAFQFIIGICYGWFYGYRSDFTGSEWVYMFSAPVYVALGLFARRHPLLLYVGFAIQLQFIIHLSFLPGRGSIWLDGRIFEVPIVLVMLWAHAIESKHEQERKGLRSVGFGIKQIIRLAAYAWGLVGSILTLIIVSARLSSMAKLSALSASPPENEFNAAVNTFAKEARVDMALCALAGCVITLCVLGCCVDIARGRSNPEGAGHIEPRIRADGTDPL